MIYDKSTIVFEPIPTNPLFIDRTGQTFARLTVLGYAGRKAQPQWFCECECGNIIIVDGPKLPNGNTKSCGCWHKQRASEANITHGRNRTPEHQTWKHIKGRCYNPATKQFKDYGGRGITVCDRWINSFEAFFEDMGLRPGPAYSIERVDNEGDYCPENCIWELKIPQANNKRNNHKITFRDRTQTMAQWCRELNAPYDRVKARLRYGWCPECVFTLGFYQTCPHRNI